MPPGIKLLLAGPIGAGKSTVGAVMGGLGFEVINADLVGHAVIEPGGPAFAEVAAAFPQAVNDGRIDRSTLASVVFADRTALSELENLTHPHIRDLILKNVAASDSPAVVVEVPFPRDFLGNGWSRVSIEAPEPVRAQRLLDRGMTSGDIQSRIAVQPAEAEWRTWADHRIENVGSRANLVIEVERLVTSLRRRQAHRSIALLMGAGALLIALFEVIGWSWFQYDMIEYRQHAEAWASGLVPYLDRDFEHLPLASVPMLAAWFLGGFVSSMAYRITFGLLMLVCLGGVQWQLFRLGGSIPGSIGAPERNLWMVTSILPVVIFRYDPLMILIVVGAVLALSRSSSWVATGFIAGAWIKGWPLVMGAISWWRGRRREALTVLGVGLGGLVTVAFLPGFRRPRSFSGVHIETLSGSASAWLGSVTDGSVDIIPAAGSIYVEAAPALLILQVAVGVALGLVTLVIMAGTEGEWPEVFLAISVLIGAVLVASPLFSSHFLLWMMPFVALGTRIRNHQVLTLLGVLTVAGVTIGLRELTEGRDPIIFSSLLLTRNLLLIAFLVQIVQILRKRARSHA